MRERTVGEVIWQRAVKQSLAKKETVEQRQHGVKEQVAQASGEFPRKTAQEMQGLEEGMNSMGLIDS